MLYAGKETESEHAVQRNPKNSWKQEEREGTWETKAEIGTGKKYLAMQLDLNAACL